jgi:hypothetical protein
MEAAAMGFEERVRVLLALQVREQKGGEKEEKGESDRGEKMKRRIGGIDVDVQDGKGSTALFKV